MGRKQRREAIRRRLIRVISVRDRNQQKTEVYLRDERADA
jgi:hypothetical protein